MIEPSLFLAVLLAAPAAGAPPRRKGGSIELGMSRAQVRKALDGKGIVDQHLKGLGKPAKEGRAGGVATYEWSKEKFTVLLQVNLEDGTALRREIRDRELEGQ